MTEKTQQNKMAIHSQFKKYICFAHRPISDATTFIKCVSRTCIFLSDSEDFLSSPKLHFSYTLNLFQWLITKTVRA